MINSWGEWLDAAIDRQQADMVALRRHLHQNPEISGEEQETSLYLYQLLGESGFTVRMGPDGRGVVADVPGGEQASPRIAFRADIDALRIQDAKQVSYCSRNEGIMHACGHDAHTALVYGASRALLEATQAGVLPINPALRTIFQPAEETCQGAGEMISIGALENVDSILAVHMDPTRPLGVIGLRAGVLTANCDEMKIVVSGHGGHAARPHETSDPIAATAQLINSLYLYIPRVTDSQEAVVITIGQVTGGENANVIPEQVTLRGTIRSLDHEVRRKTMRHVERLAAGIGQTTQTNIEVSYGLSSDSVTNDPHIIALLRQACQEVVGTSGIQEILRPSMGSEDFAFYLQQVPGAMIRVGCASQTHGGSPLHTPTFDIDERVLGIGAKVLARAAVLRALQIEPASTP